jgi:hypothetical protein
MPCLNRLRELFLEAIDPHAAIDNGRREPSAPERARHA